MDENRARELLEREDYTVSHVRAIPEGRSHHCFDVVVEKEKELMYKGKRKAVVRFENLQKVNANGERRDSFFFSPLSLTRENYLCNLVRKKAKLPAPKTYEYNTDGEVRFILAEKLEGKVWSEHLASKNHSTDAFLTSLEGLGADIAKAQRVTFKNYGDIIGQGVINPGHKHSIGSRLYDISVKETDARNAIFGIKLNDELSDYFSLKSTEIHNAHKNKKAKPVLVLGDIHEGNFLIGKDGKPSGYFDLESCQAGHPAFELYRLKTNLFNYYDASAFEQGENAFFKGFEANGGEYDRNDPVNQMIENFLTLQFLSSATRAYHGIKAEDDPVRSTWSEQFREIMQDGMRNDKVDYMAISDVTLPAQHRDHNQSPY